MVWVDEAPRGEGMRNEGANNSVLQNKQLLEREEEIIVKINLLHLSQEPPPTAELSAIQPVWALCTRASRVTSLVYSGVCVGVRHERMFAEGKLIVGQSSMSVGVGVCHCEVMSEGNERKCSGEQRCDGKSYHDGLRFTVRLRRVDWEWLRDMGRYSLFHLLYQCVVLPRCSSSSQQLTV